MVLGVIGYQFSHLPMLLFLNVSRIDFLFNPTTGESVIKFGVSSTRTDQIVVDDQHIRLDRWDGVTWTNIWTK